MIFSTVNILFLRWMIIMAVLFFSWNPMESIRLKKFPREKLFFLCDFFMTSCTTVYLFENCELDARGAVRNSFQ